MAALAHHRDARDIGWQAAEMRRKAADRQCQTSADRDFGNRLSAVLRLDIPATEGGLGGLIFTDLMLRTWDLTAEEVLASGNRVVGYPAPVAPLARAA